MTDDARLAAATEYFKRVCKYADEAAPIRANGVLAAIDADDPLRQPVTEEEARVALGMLAVDSGGCEPPWHVALSMHVALTAFLAARGATCKPALQVGVTDEMVERACEAGTTEPGYTAWRDLPNHIKGGIRKNMRRALEAARGVAASEYEECLATQGPEFVGGLPLPEPGFHGGVMDNPLPDIELRALARRVFAVEESLEDKRNENTSILRALAERVEALETNFNAATVLIRNAHHRLDALEYSHQSLATRADTRLDGHAHEFDLVMNRLDALEARPAWTESQADVVLEGVRWLLADAKDCPTRSRHICAVSEAFRRVAPPAPAKPVWPRDMCRAPIENDCPHIGMCEDAGRCLGGAP